MSRERVIAFVDLRPPSRRLTRKFERRLGERSLLEWVLSGWRACREVDRVVLITGPTARDATLIEMARACGVECFSDPDQQDGQASRLARAAVLFEADLAVVARADRPLVDASTIDDWLGRFRAAPDEQLLLPVGGSSALRFAARAPAFGFADALIDSPELLRAFAQSEHGLRVLEVEAPDSALRQRWLVDSWADLEFMQALRTRLEVEGVEFELGPAEELLKREPQLSKLNHHVVDERPGSSAEHVLFVADAGGEIGFGHLMRCRELALQLGERSGRKAVFLLDDEEAVRRIEACGLETQWGALERPVRQAPDSRPVVDALAAVERSCFVVLDLFGKRELAPGWRSRLGRPTLVLDRAEPWCEEADCIVVPGVTFPEEWQLPMEFGRAGTPLHGGAEFVIQRREIRQVTYETHEREVDVLAYLYGESERSALREFGRAHGLRVRVLEQPAADFPRLLAQSRIFVSGFGITFYEAIALGTRPVAWPLSEPHERDALRFYRALGIPPTVLRGAADLELLLELLARPAPAPRAIADGTFRIVELIDRALRTAGPAARA